MNLSLPIIVAVLLLLVVASAIRILKEYERGVMFTLGRFTGVKGPGVRLVLPVIQQMKTLELRTVVLNVPKQDVISRDNVSVKVSAVVYFRIVDPEKAILQVVNPYEATSQLAQTTLRSVAGQHEMDELLAQREKQAAQTLAEAAKILSKEPASLQLRYLQTLADISNEKSSIIVFPLPLDLITPLLRPTRHD